MRELLRALLRLLETYAETMPNLLLLRSALETSSGPKDCGILEERPSDQPTIADVDAAGSGAGDAFKRRGWKQKQQQQRRWYEQQQQQQQQRQEPTLRPFSNCCSPQYVDQLLAHSGVTLADRSFHRTRDVLEGGLGLLRLRPPGSNAEDEEEDEEEKNAAAGEKHAKAESEVASKEATQEDEAADPSNSSDEDDEEDDEEVVSVHDDEGDEEASEASEEEDELVDELTWDILEQLLGFRHTFHRSHCPWLLYDTFKQDLLTEHGNKSNDEGNVNDAGDDNADYDGDEFFDADNDDDHDDDDDDGKEDGEGARAALLRRFVPSHVALRVKPLIGALSKGAFYECGRRESGSSSGGGGGGRGSDDDAPVGAAAARELWQLVCASGGVWLGSEFVALERCVWFTDSGDSSSSSTSHDGGSGGDALWSALRHVGCQGGQAVVSVQDSLRAIMEPLESSTNHSPFGDNDNDNDNDNDGNDYEDDENENDEDESPFKEGSTDGEFVLDILLRAVGACALGSSSAPPLPHPTTLDMMLDGTLPGLLKQSGIGASSSYGRAGAASGRSSSVVSRDCMACYSAVLSVLSSGGFPANRRLHIPVPTATLALRRLVVDRNLNRGAGGSSRQRFTFRGGGGGGGSGSGSGRDDDSDSEGTRVVFGSSSSSSDAVAVARWYSRTPTPGRSPRICCYGTLAKTACTHPSRRPRPFGLSWNSNRSASNLRAHAWSGAFGSAFASSPRSAIILPMAAAAAEATTVKMTTTKRCGLSSASCTRFASLTTMTMAVVVATAAAPQ